MFIVQRLTLCPVHGSFKRTRPSIRKTMRSPLASNHVSEVKSQQRKKGATLRFVARLYYHKLYCSISDEWYIALCYKGYIQVFFNTSLEKKAIHILQYSVNVSEMYPNTVLIIRTWKCKIYTFKIHIIACIGKYIKLTWNSKMHCRIFII